jgi:hypothetical protein
LTKSNAVIVHGFVEEVINNGDVDAAARFVWDDVVGQVPLPGQEELARRGAA